MAAPERIVLDRIVCMRDAYIITATETKNNVQNLAADDKVDLVWEVPLGVVRVTQLGRLGETTEILVPVTSLCQMWPKRAEKKK